MNNIFKSKGCIIKDNGTLADLSKKVSLFINELSDEQVVILNRLVRDQAVDVIILPHGLLKDVEGAFQQAIEYIGDDSAIISSESLDLIEEEI